MAPLQESLNKFKKQQERCQTTMTSIKAAGSKLTPKVKVAPHSNSAVKFSNNVERLQMINSVRNASTGVQIKRVLDLLHQTRQSFTADQINEATYIDLNANKAVFDALKHNGKVNYDGSFFSFKPTHDLNDKHQLLVLIRKYPEGIAVAELKDAYPTVMDDLQALKSEGEVWLLSHKKENIAYPNDPKVAMKVDDDLKKLYFERELPSEMIDIEKDLQKNGMRPATNTLKRRAAGQLHCIAHKPNQKKKKREFNKRTKLTNTHLPELFKK